MSGRFFEAAVEAFETIKTKTDFLDNLFVGLTYDGATQEELRAHKILAGRLKRVFHFLKSNSPTRHWTALSFLLLYLKYYDSDKVVMRYSIQPLIAFASRNAVEPHCVALVVVSLSFEWLLLNCEEKRFVLNKLVEITRRKEFKMASQQMAYARLCSILEPVGSWRTLQADVDLAAGRRRIDERYVEQVERSFI